MTDETPVQISAADQAFNEEMLNITRKGVRAKVAVLALMSFFVAATTLGIQLGNRAEGRARDAQLTAIEAQGEKLERILDVAASFDSPESRAETAAMLDRVLATADCNTRTALTEAFEDAGLVRPGELSVTCEEDPPATGSGD